MSPIPVPNTDVTCDEWSFYLLPLDEDIISMELPEFFRDYFLVSGTLQGGGDSPSYPLYLTGAGDKVLFGEEVCEVLLSPSAHTVGLVCSPGAVSVGEWRLAPELAPLLLAEQLRGIPLCSS